MEGKYDNEGDLSWGYLFPRVSWYKRGSDITEGDVKEGILTPKINK